MIETVVTAHQPDHPEPLTITFTYDPTDPFTVAATFTTGGGYQVQWHFARDLLRDGLVGPAGIGDVRIFPHRGRRQIGIVLSTDEWSDALYLVDRAPVAQFVLDMYHAVPDTMAIALFDGLLEQELLTLDSEMP